MCWIAECQISSWHIRNIIEAKSSNSSRSHMWAHANLVDVNVFLIWALRKTWLKRRARSIADFIYSLCSLFNILQKQRIFLWEPKHRFTFHQKCFQLKLYDFNWHVCCVLLCVHFQSQYYSISKFKMVTKGKKKKHNVIEMS